MCLAAGIVLAQLPDSVAVVLGSVGLPRAAGKRLGRLLQSGCMLLTVALSLSRTAALVANYSAPMSIYMALPPVRSPPPHVSPDRGWGHWRVGLHCMIVQRGGCLPPYLSYTATIPVCVTRRCAHQWCLMWFVAPICTEVVTPQHIESSSDVCVRPSRWRSGRRGHR